MNEAGMFNGYEAERCFDASPGPSSCPRLSPQNRPYVISSKPANGIGRRRDCFTLLQRAIARFRIEPSRWCLLLWFYSAGVAPCGVLHGR